MASANNPTIREEMKMTSHKKAPGGRWSIHQGQHGKANAMRTFVLYQNPRKFTRG